VGTSNPTILLILYLRYELILAVKVLLESGRWTPSFRRSILLLSSRKRGVNMMSWLRKPQFESIVNLHGSQFTQITWSVLNLRSSLYHYTPQWNHSFTAVKCNFECWGNVLHIALLRLPDYLSTRTVMSVRPHVTGPRLRDRSLSG
jgi:hypothetical protein